MGGRGDPWKEMGPFGEGGGELQLAVVGCGGRGRPVKPSSQLLSCVWGGAHPTPSSEVEAGMKEKGDALKEDEGPE